MAHDERADGVAHHHHLDGADASPVTGSGAFRASHGLVEDDLPLRLEAAQVHLVDHFGQRRMRLAAFRAQRAHQALREDAVHRGREQVILRAHVEEPAHRRRRVVGVHGGEHHVAGQRGLHRDPHRLHVADLAHHDDVRVLAHDGAQGVREGEVDLRLHLDLVDAGHLVFDRVLDGDDLHVGLVEPVEGRIKGGGLAASRGAGHEEDAVHLVERADEALERLALEAEGGEIERHAALVEDAHHDALAVHGRHGGHAQVDLLAGDAQLDAPILRKAALGDVERSHDLHARDDGRGEPAGRGLDFMEHAVDAVAHDEPVLERLDVDVGGTRFQRAREDQVDEADHRRLGGEVLQVLDVAPVLLLVARGDVVDDLAHGRLAAAIEALERGLDLVGRGDVGANALA